MKYFIYIVIAVVAIAIIAGFFIVGSPNKARLLAFDGQRVQDLQFIQSEIVNYWQSKVQLPPNLAALVDPIRGVVIPRDPKTSADYVYEIKDAVKLTFNLCATFNLTSEIDTSTTMPVPPPLGTYLNQNWTHSAGYHCFERIIDKDLYPPFPKTKIIQ